VSGKECRCAGLSSHQCDPKAELDPIYLLFLELQFLIWYGLVKIVVCVYLVQFDALFSIMLKNMKK